MYAQLFYWNLTFNSVILITIIVLLNLQRIAFTVSWSRPGRGPFFPLIELVRNSSSVKSSIINNRNKRVGCLLQRRSAAASDEDLIKMPMFFTSSTRWIGIWIHKEVILVAVNAGYIVNIHRNHVVKYTVEPIAVNVGTW